MKVIEHVVRVTRGEHAVRVWFQAEKDGPTEVDHLEQLNRAVFAVTREEFHWQSFTPEYLAERILKKLTDVNAIEVTTHNIGAVIYPSWP